MLTKICRIILAKIQYQPLKIKQPEILFQWSNQKEPKNQYDI